MSETSEGLETEYLPPLPEIDLENNSALQEVMELLHFTEEEKIKMNMRLREYLPQSRERISQKDVDEIVDNNMSRFIVLGEVRDILKLDDETGKEIMVPYSAFRGFGAFVEGIETKTLGYLIERDKIEQKEGKTDKPRHTEPNDLDIIIPYNIRVLSKLSDKLKMLHEDSRIILKDPDRPVSYSQSRQGSSSHVDKMWSRAFIRFQIENPLKENEFVTVEMFSDHHLVAEDKAKSIQKGRKVWDNISIADLGMDWEQFSAADIAIQSKGKNEDFPLFRGKALLATYINQARETIDEDRRDKACTRAIATLLSIESRKNKEVVEQETKQTDSINRLRALLANKDK